MFLMKRVVTTIYREPFQKNKDKNLRIIGTSNSFADLQNILLIYRRFLLTIHLSQKRIYYNLLQ